MEIDLPYVSTTPVEVLEDRVKPLGADSTGEIPRFDPDGGYLGPQARYPIGVDSDYQPMYPPDAPSTAPKSVSPAGRHRTGAARSRSSSLRPAIWVVITAALLLASFAALPRQVFWWAAASVGGLVALILLAALARFAVTYWRTRKGPPSVITAARERPTLGGRIHVGMQTRRVPTDGSGLDRPTLLWLESKTDKDFHVIRIVCTFEPVEGETIQAADVELELVGDRLDSPAAVVWSLLPQRVALGQPTKRTATLGADLKFITASMSEEITEQPQVTAQGMGELKPWARWTFSSAVGSGLFGDQDLQVIAMCQKGDRVTCPLTVRFRLQYGVRAGYYRADIPASVGVVTLSATG